MSDLAQLRVWDDPAIRGALSWYLDVAENRYPAKFRIAARLLCSSILQQVAKMPSGPSSTS
jgi:hypothetical protein